jgi:hypothetical protein
VGADGHVTIFRLQPLKDKYPDDWAEFTLFVADGVTYKHTILETEVLTVYRGDNLHIDALLDVLANYVRKVEPLDVYKNIDSYVVKSLSKLPLKKLKLYVEMAKFLYASKYDDIEVWT